MKVLTVERKRFNQWHIETTLRNEDGKVKAIFNNMLNQPRKGTKQIIINCNTYLLDWGNVK